MKGIWAVAGLGVLIALGCSGIMGYGNELGNTNIQPGTPFSMTYTTADAEPHNVWLDYDVNYSNDYSVTGPFSAAAGATSLKTWSMSLTKEGSPVSGGRFTMNNRSTNMNGTGWSSATIFLVEVPAQPVGTGVTVSGTFSAGPGTTVNQLRLVVTD